MTDWKNWKTGAIIGLLYGIIGMIFYSVLWFALSQPHPPGQPVLDNDGGLAVQMGLMGLLVFFPLVGLWMLTEGMLSSFIPAGYSQILAVASMPLYGTLIGAVIGYLFEPNKGT